MQSLVYLGPGAAALEERPDPRPSAPDDVVVRVIGTGICGTDRKILLGHFPARPGVVLGHESVGVVSSVGEAVTGLAEGDRVVVNPTLYCGHCARCRRGATNHCLNKSGTEVGVDRDGTFAEFVVLPERFVSPLPANLPFRRAVLIEPLACVLNNVRAGGVGYDDVVVVLGAGPIGMLVAAVCERLARRVVVVEADPYRLDLARSRFRRVVSPAEDVGEAPSVVVETTGNHLDEALGLVADGGRVVVMGFDDSYTSQVTPLRLTNRGISVIGAGDYPAEVFPQAVDLIGGLDLPELVTHEFPLADHEAAFGALSVLGYSAMKVVIRSDAGVPAGPDGWPGER
ncbi:zinc-dependent alcohol dehydrogenase [Kineosporia succinea]|uniref:Fructokinase n=1 Tax=Kineosporia succinea TaxID=84632 RepID=A0ABT9NVQ3_9ACTN|nr:alcohol dehydrogenase catalytic domain-containing protein [Kineosporia succinea]MDP9824401.1 fructokinase [Kineosporia succinea]